METPKKEFKVKVEPKTPKANNVPLQEPADQGSGFPPVVATFFQSAITTLAVSVVTAVGTEFTYWTGLVAGLVQNCWQGFIQACLLSLEVIRYRIVEIIGILFFGGTSIRIIVQDGLKLILSIFQGAFQIVRELVKGPIQLSAEAEMPQLPQLVDNMELD